MRWLIEWLRRREDTHANPYSAHARKMMALDRQDREQPWLKNSYRQWNGR